MLRFMDWMNDNNILMGKKERKRHDDGDTGINNSEGYLQPFLSAICYCYGRGLPTSVSPCEVKSLLTNYYHDNIYYYLLALLDVIILLLNKRKLYLLHFFFLCCSVCRRPFRSLLCGLFGRFANKLFFSSHSRNTTQRHPRTTIQTTRKKPPREWPQKYSPNFYNLESLIMIRNYTERAIRWSDAVACVHSSLTA